MSLLQFFSVDHLYLITDLPKWESGAVTVDFVRVSKTAGVCGPFKDKCCNNFCKCRNVQLLTLRNIEKWLQNQPNQIFIVFFTRKLVGKRFFSWNERVNFIQFQASVLPGLLRGAPYSLGRWARHPRGDDTSQNRYNKGQPPHSLLF